MVYLFVPFHTLDNSSLFILPILTLRTTTAKLTLTAPLQTKRPVTLNVDCRGFCSECPILSYYFNRLASLAQSPPIPRSPHPSQCPQ